MRQVYRPGARTDGGSNVKPSLALSIGAVLALIFGLGLFLTPVQVLAGFGLAAPVEA